MKMKQTLNEIIWDHVCSEIHTSQPFITGWVEHCKLLGMCNEIAYISCDDEFARIALSRKTPTEVIIQILNCLCGCELTELQFGVDGIEREIQNEKEKFRKASKNIGRLQQILKESKPKTSLKRSLYNFVFGK